MHSFIKFLLNIYCCGPGFLCSIKRRWLADRCSQCSVMRALVSYRQGAACAHKRGNRNSPEKVNSNLRPVWDSLVGGAGRLQGQKVVCVEGLDVSRSMVSWWGEYCHGPKGRTKWWLALDSMSVPPFKYIYCSPYPHCDGIWGWDLVKVVKLWGWSPCYGINAHIRRNVRERMSLT